MQQDVENAQEPSAVYFFTLMADIHRDYSVHGFFRSVCLCVCVFACLCPGVLGRLFVQSTEYATESSRPSNQRSNQRNSGRSEKKRSETVVVGGSEALPLLLPYYLGIFRWIGGLEGNATIPPTPLRYSYHPHYAILVARSLALFIACLLACLVVCVYLPALVLVLSTFDFFLGGHALNTCLYKRARCAFLVSCSVDKPFYVGKRHPSKIEHFYIFCTSPSTISKG